jgi:uncharacterized RDD family membrane protein YckC
MVIHSVITTEKVPFTYRVAGPGSRFLAWLVDGGMIFLLLVAGFGAGSVLEMAQAGMGLALIALWMFGLSWGYFLLFEWLWHGQTPGKRLIGIRVINLRGTRIGFFQAALRNLLRSMDGFPPQLPVLYGVGLVAAACNRENRRLGDLAASTLVVHVDRKAKPIQIIQENNGDAHLAKEELFRQRLQQLSRDQKQTVLDICLRRDQLRISDRARLFRSVADYLRTRLELAPEQFQSDEKFILQVAAILTE